MMCRRLLLSLASAVLFWSAAPAVADIIAVESGVPDVLRFTPAGVRTTFATANLDSPIGINVDAANNVYVVNNGASSTSTFHDSVAKFSPTGTPQGFFVTPATPPGNTLNAPIDIAFDRTGNAYVTNTANYVAQYNSAGAFQLSFGLANTNLPTGVGLNPTNSLLYIVNSGTTGTNANSILIYNPANIAANPTIITPTGAGALDNGQQVAFDQTGNVFIASNGSTTGVSRIQEFSSSGAYIQTVATVPAGNAEGVAYDPTLNTLFVSYLGGGPTPTATSGFIEKYTIAGATSVDAGPLATGLNMPGYLVFQPVPVPEPGSVVLMGLGLVAVAGFGSRRCRRGNTRAA